MESISIYYNKFKIIFLFLFLFLVSSGFLYMFYLSFKDHSISVIYRILFLLLGLFLLYCAFSAYFINFFRPNPTVTFNQDNLIINKQPYEYAEITNVQFFSDPGVYVEPGWPVWHRVMKITMENGKEIILEALNVDLKEAEVTRYLKNQNIQVENLPIEKTSKWIIAGFYFSGIFIIFCIILILYF